MAITNAGSTQQQSPRGDASISPPVNSDGIPDWMCIQMDEVPEGTANRALSTDEESTTTDSKYLKQRSAVLNVIQRLDRGNFDYARTTELIMCTLRRFQADVPDDRSKNILKILVQAFPDLMYRSCLAIIRPNHRRFSTEMSLEGLRIKLVNKANHRMSWTHLNRDKAHENAKIFVLSWYLHHIRECFIYQLNWRERLWYRATLHINIIAVIFTVLSFMSTTIIMAVTEYRESHQ